MEHNSAMACSPEDSVSELEKDMLCSSLEGKERKAYMTAKEIASSERVFVDCLRLICVDFRTVVKEAGNSKDNLAPIIPEAELNKILNYLPQLQNLNCELLNDFELRLRHWSTQPKISDVIVRKGPFLKLYSAYIRDFQSQSALLDECVQKYPRFGKVLKQFEQSERCKNLSLKHYMLKPVQVCLCFIRLSIESALECSLPFFVATSSIPFAFGGVPSPLEWKLCRLPWHISSAESSHRCCWTCQ